MKIQVIAAWPDRAIRQTLDAPEGSTIATLARHPDLLPSLQAAWALAAEVGVFGVRKKATEPLEDGDRIELWRDLQADPKEARRARAKARRQKDSPRASG
jgi:uncharacterized protein